ncbi:MAG: hypothetical protein GY861_28735 [bacterium]|nr:hypothetical protein [bacterium]
MGRTRYNRISELLKPIVGKTLHKNKIWRRIVIDIGASETLVRESMNLMITLGLIQEVKQDYFKVISNKADI